MRVWFRAMHLLAQDKKGLSRRLQHKLMQAMLERDRRYQLGAAGPRIEIDDAYVGGERSGEGSGRGRRGHTPFIVAIGTSDDGRPLHGRLQVVRGFRAGETKRLCAAVGGRNHRRQRRTMELPPRVTSISAGRKPCRGRRGRRLRPFHRRARR